MIDGAPHIPVLLNEVISGISPKDGGIYVDGTFGAGGYTRAVLTAANCKVIAIDRDPDAVRDGQKLCREFEGRLTLLHGEFGDMVDLVRQTGTDAVDGVMLDIGVSSMQVDQAERGFSFKKDGFLDMRMSRQGLSAADVVNTFSQEELANIIYLYGEERFSRRIASAIVARRKEKAFERTLDFANVVRSAIPHKGNDGTDPATRTFQALRIYVNDELEQLRSGLNGAEELLKTGGRMAVVSFHSLEDRIVKNIFRTSERPCICPPEFPVCVCGRVSKGKVITRKPIVPGKEELEENSRSKSAKLRVFERRITEG